MTLFSVFKNSLLLAVCCVFVGACAPAASPTHDDGVVQDIKPGDKSVIQAPMPGAANKNTLEERSI